MNSTELVEIELGAIKSSLILQKSEILNKSIEFKLEQSNSTQIADEAELASQDISNNISIHLYERDRHCLMMIERALGKISEGTYGLCEACGDQIDLRRLKARPFTTFCIACMEEKEDSKNTFQ